MHLNQLAIRRVAVLGAGVMGAQIAAHLVNADVETLLFDLPAPSGDPNGVATKAIQALAKFSPAPLAAKIKAHDIVPANYAQHLEAIASCDLIIEAVAERMEIKAELYRSVVPHVAPHAIFASNTSGLSIATLGDALPEDLRRRFCGVHFFNPPRYMHLVEVIPHQQTDLALLAGLETFLTAVLGKGVVFAKDTPNFIGNRIGVFSILAVMHHTEAFGLGFDAVDGLTGPLLGRPKSATYRTADVVGLDTLAHVIATMQRTLPDDPWHAFFGQPAWLSALIAKGSLGQKSKIGIYRKRGEEIQVLDPASGDYRPTSQKISVEVEGIMKIKNPGERLAKLRESNDRQAQFLWAVLRDLFHYCAFHLETVADNARDVDFAIRWGYGWERGPFETWQAAGWHTVADWIQTDIAAGKTMAKAPLPKWAIEPDRQGVHQADGSYSAATQRTIPRSRNPVYLRQPRPDLLLGERLNDGTTLLETPGVRFWQLPIVDGIGILSFKTKLNTISAEVIAGIHQAVDFAEKNLAGMVIYQAQEPFSAGADLSSAVEALIAGRIAEFESTVHRFQQTSLRIKYALVPVVAAVRGLALGGGCEFQMHCAKTVAALESYIGLVEAGVGLLPAGGGCKEIALRCWQKANQDPFQFIKSYFETVAMAKVSSSALEAKELGLLRENDRVVFNPHELLYVALTEAKAMAESGYRPSLTPRQIGVAGRVGTATLRAMLVNMHAGKFISDHDLEVGARIAAVLCGGEIERGSAVDEQWLLDREREHFVALAQTAKTQERILHTLKTGKPLRN